MTHRLTQHQVPVSLRRLFPRASFVGCADVRVIRATERSGECTTGTLFAAIPGHRVNGEQYATDAIGRGATSLLVEQPLADIAVPQCIVRNARRSYSQLCAELAGRPSTRLHLSAVTGTNGKTTVTWLLRSILEAAGKQAGLLGTIEYSDGINSEPATLTTPDSSRLSTSLRDMLLSRTTHAAIELSSHALHQDRCAGTYLDVAIVTNVTQDHFDYHGDAQSYLDSKARIVEHLKPNGVLIVNADNVGSSSIGQQAADRARIVTYGIDSPADVTVEIIEETTTQSRFVIRFADEQIEVQSALVGRHNISNCLAAAATAMCAGIPISAIADGIEKLACVPGRLERIEVGQPFDLFVDYAHTDDALRRVLDGLKRISARRVICVFGAGGDRDSSKRPLLGRAASLADVAIVTSDNPRSEDPADIVQDIVQGFPTAVSQPLIELDRADAIRRAIEIAEPGDCVVIAGKGHETEQIIGSERLAFNDSHVARQALLKFLHLQAVPQVKMRA
ncbi:MAG: UDP-N-acetylmuramoyl-L-alanyl-D-glutamate--2,6-diaminopimelate ligase [Planctomycetaceae bacterium]|nr:UDP-N-acetylmuramoyl-L-alanyl-D-glutamate--2,6-diaminopimelate ligase [Planctomycetaceae bacterium]MBT6156239.1 UDP-N-acetylmuramoyl-L-alanyl-D-glutamate--2,6-diaminopimelate ligase [Planctomycetaceae bacterium]MBT6487893.1 UDP-N-acetylmuramoyl-L-alanyl-D-glutamate--2,6-diaminopimelate ligase [Planctomycetaceae bacterium]